MRRRCGLVCLKPGHMVEKCPSSVKCLIYGRRLCTLLYPKLRKENPSSLKEKGKRDKKKASRITSELTSEETQREGLAIIDILQREQSSESKEKTKWHFSSPSAPWYGGWLERMVRSINRFYKSALAKLVG
ncbi:hypothetical protein TNCT_483871 [Trichonephila clavata]|uniref:Uncharacterized protein n=1 Tax=Trichonephila clavata TaxID=2740835 RepID=A0A8X6HP58_TRICU|nr:hypothetical protein TNCT_483871 [Trichonephila clavata]